MLRARAQLSWLAQKHIPTSFYARPRNCIRRFTSAATATPTRASAPMERPQVILEYWFGPTYKAMQKDYFDGDKTKIWFFGGAEVDKYITENFKADVEKVASGEYDSWLESPDPLNGLAGVILMDQFTRNIYRGSAQSFALDPKARTWAKELLDSGKADALPHMIRTFLMLPLMHSEDLADQERCVGMYHAETAAAEAGLGSESPVTGMLKNFSKFAEQHKEVVERWGRFPHRNGVLGRADTEEETKGLAEGTIKKFG